MLFGDHSLEGGLTPVFSVFTRGIPTHHHRNDREEIPVALDSGEAKRNHIGEEDHCWTKANNTQDLREGRRDVMKSDTTVTLSGKLPAKLIASCVRCLIL